MRQIIGGIVLVGAAVLLYAFAIQGTFHAESPQSPNFGLPFVSLGANYPLDAILCVGAVWTLILGLLLVFLPRRRADAPPRRGGMAAKIMLVNALIMVSLVFLAFAGAKGNAAAGLVGAFAAIAGVQIVAGLVLLVFSFMERPKGIVSLVLGMLLWIGGTAIGVLAFLQGA